MDNKMVLAEQDFSDEIDDISYTGFSSTEEAIDPFSMVKIDSLSPRMKRKAYKIQKRHEGEDGTKSKYLDPEVVNGYSLWDIVNPPYDLDSLAKLYDQSAIHCAAINARVMNTVGLGFEFSETLKSRRRIEKAQDDPAKLERTRKNLQDLREELEVLFEDLNIEETLIEADIDLSIVDEMIEELKSEKLSSFEDACGYLKNEFKTKLDGGSEELKKHEEELAARLLGYLASKKDIRIIGEQVADKDKRVPTISFVHDKFDLKFYLNLLFTITVNF